MVADGSGFCACRPAKIRPCRSLVCGCLAFLRFDRSHAMFGIADIVTYTIAAAVLVALLNLG